MTEFRYSGDALDNLSREELAALVLSQQIEIVALEDQRNELLAKCRAFDAIRPKLEEIARILGIW